MRGAYRSIGVNRNGFLRPDPDAPGKAARLAAPCGMAGLCLQRLQRDGSPFYADVEETPEYLANTTAEVSTDNFYWTSRMIAAMADASYSKSLIHVERCPERVAAKSHALLNRYDALLEKETDAAARKGAPAGGEPGRRGYGEKGDGRHAEQGAV